MFVSVSRRTVVCLVAVALLAAPASGGSANTLPRARRCPLFPSNNVWHSDVSTLPVHPSSDEWMAFMGGPRIRLHPDFGPPAYGIPYTVEGAAHQKVSIRFAYADESDPGPYPFGSDTPIEGGANSDGDRHALMVDRTTCTLYELFDARYSRRRSTAGSGAI